MSQRYHVYNGNRLIGVIHAQDGERAILLACTKTDGNVPARCTAEATAVRVRSSRQQSKFPLLVPSTQWLSPIRS